MDALAKYTSHLDLAHSFGRQYVQLKHFIQYTALNHHPYMAVSPMTLGLVLKFHQVACSKVCQGASFCFEDQRERTSSEAEAVRSAAGPAPSCVTGS